MMLCPELFMEFMEQQFYKVEEFFSLSLMLSWNLLENPLDNTILQKYLSFNLTSVCCVSSKNNNNIEINNNTTKHNCET